MLPSGINTVGGMPKGYASVVAFSLLRDVALVELPGSFTEGSVPFSSGSGRPDMPESTSRRIRVRVRVSARGRIDL